MTDHDAGYKRLFSHPEMVADLLAGFVDGPWVKEVELDTLERVSGSFVSDDFRERENDVIWRVRWRDGWLYVYLLLEFQSTVDRFMALRIMVYVGMLYQDLIRSKQLTDLGRLPPVLPIVLYNGERPWNAAKDVEELVESVPGGLEHYRPRMRYLLLEERAYEETELAAMQNLVAALFRLENSLTPTDVYRVLNALGAWLRQPQQSELVRSFVDWLREVLLPRRMPGVEMPKFENLREVRTLLAERVKEWTRQWREEGLEKGREEGLEEGLEKGRKEGESRLLARLLERKFGPLDEEIRRRIDEADTEQLLEWGERIPTAERLEEVFA